MFYKMPVKVATISFAVFFINAVLANEEEIPIDPIGTSYITVPFSVDLKTVQARAQSLIPKRIAKIDEPKKICVPAKWAKWDYPCFKGIKWYTCKGKTKVSPDMSCTVDGYVDSDGKLEIGGSSNVIRATLPIKAKVTARDIGSVIKSQTAEARAKVSVSASLDLNPNWSPVVNVNPKYSWTKRPTIKLFKLVPITIGSKVEPKIDELIKENLEELPKHLADLGIRESVEEVWKEAHKPIKLHDNPKTFLVLGPQAISFPGFNIDNNILTGSIGLKTTVEVVLASEMKPNEPTELPELDKEPFSNSGIDFEVPLNVDLSELERSFEEEFPSGTEIDLEGSGLPGHAEISSVGIRGDKEGLQLDIGVQYDERSGFVRAIDIFDWFTVDGTLSFNALPRIDMDKRLLSFANVEYDSNTQSELLDVLVDIADLPFIKEQVASRLKYSFGKDIEKLKEQVNTSINTEIGDDVTLRGEINEISVDGISVEEDKLHLSVRIKGALAALVDGS